MKRKIDAVMNYGALWGCRSRRLTLGLGALTSLLALSSPAAAESSSYGCPQYVVRGSDIYVQGSEGVFFRLKPDLDV